MASAIKKTSWIFVNLIDERIDYSENEQPVIYLKSEIFDRMSMI